MKNFIKLFFFLSVAILLNSCGASDYKYQLRLNSQSTVAHVELSKKNFKVVDYVTGEASSAYVLGIHNIPFVSRILNFDQLVGVGGLNKRALVEKARSEMYKNANMVGTSRVILNENVDYYYENFPFVKIVKVTVSGYLYEFTE